MFIQVAAGGEDGFIPPRVPGCEPSSSTRFAIDTPWRVGEEGDEDEGGYSLSGWPPRVGWMDGPKVALTEGRGRG